MFISHPKSVIFMKHVKHRNVFFFNKMPKTHEFTLEQRYQIITLKKKGIQGDK